MSDELASLGDDTKCSSEPQSLIAEYFIDCEPAGQPLEDGGTIPASQVCRRSSPTWCRTPCASRSSCASACSSTSSAPASSGNSEALNEAIRLGAPALTDLKEVTGILAAASADLIRELNEDSSQVVSASSRRAARRSPTSSTRPRTRRRSRPRGRDDVSDQLQPARRLPRRVPAHACPSSTAWPAPRRRSSPTSAAQRPTLPGSRATCRGSTGPPRMRCARSATRATSGGAPSTDGRDEFQLLAEAGRKATPGPRAARRLPRRPRRSAARGRDRRARGHGHGPLRPRARPAGHDGLHGPRGPPQLRPQPDAGDQPVRRHQPPLPLRHLRGEHRALRLVLTRAAIPTPASRAFPRRPAARRRTSRRRPTASPGWARTSRASRSRPACPDYDPSVCPDGVAAGGRRASSATRPARGPSAARRAAGGTAHRSASGRRDTATAAPADADFPTCPNSPMHPTRTISPAASTWTCQTSAGWAAGTKSAATAAAARRARRPKTSSTSSSDHETQPDKRSRPRRRRWSERSPCSSRSSRSSSPTTRIKGLPFVPVYRVSVDVPNGARADRRERDQDRRNAGRRDRVDRADRRRVLAPDRLGRLGRRASSRRWPPGST